MLIHKPATLKEQEHYEDNKTGQKWRRITGGIGWPTSEKEGVVLVLAEDMAFPYPNYTVLNGAGDFNALGLLQKAKAFELDYPVKSWHGKSQDRSMMTLLYSFNKESENPLRFTGAPLAGETNNSGYYLPQVIEMVLVGQERLNASSAPMVKHAIESIMPETHLNRDIAEFPALAALCYSLSYLIIYAAKRVDLNRKPALKGWML